MTLSEMGTLVEIIRDNILATERDSPSVEQFGQAVQILTALEREFHAFTFHTTALQRKPWLQIEITRQWQEHASDPFLRRISSDLESAVDLAQIVLDLSVGHTERPGVGAVMVI